MDRSSEPVDTPPGPELSSRERARLELEDRLQRALETLAGSEAESLRLGHKLDRLALKLARAERERDDQEVRAQEGLDRMSSECEELRFKNRKSRNRIKKIESQLSKQEGQLAKLRRECKEAGRQPLTMRQGLRRLRATVLSIVDPASSRVDHEKSRDKSGQGATRLIAGERTEPVPVYKDQPVILFVLWSPTESEVEGALDQVDLLRLQGYDFVPVFLTDSDSFHLFRKHQVPFEYIPPNEEWIARNDVEGWPPYLKKRVASLRKMYRPAHVVVMETSGKWIAFKQGLIAALCLDDHP